MSATNARQMVYPRCRECRGHGLVAPFGSDCGTCGGEGYLRRGADGRFIPKVPAQALPEEGER